MLRVMRIGCMGQVVDYCTKISVYERVTCRYEWVSSSLGGWRGGELINLMMEFFCVYEVHSSTLKCTKLQKKHRKRYANFENTIKIISNVAKIILEYSKNSQDYVKMVKKKWSSIWFNIQ